MSQIAKRFGMSRQEMRNQVLGLLFVSPWILGFLAWTIYPLLASFYYSFTRYDLLVPPVFIGFKNYARFFTRDRDFPIVMGNTLYWVILGAPLGVAAALFMASLLNTRIKGRSFFRAIFFFPSIVPAVVTAVIWRFLLNIQFGAVNQVLKLLGLKAIPFLSSPELAKPSLLAISLWAQGNAIVVFLATLQDVPRSLYEAALVDGANAWHRFWHVTVPMISPVILFNLVMGLIGRFQTFALPWLLTGGGPNQSTEFYAMYLYRNAFTYNRMGKASALAWLLFVVVVLFTVVLFKATGRFVYYGGE